MSTIRFVHTDFLRLGSPLVGMAKPPTWLLKLATDSVRHAVRNVIEAAITQRTDFLLIAGSICDSQEDLESAARWLGEQFAPLRREGIQVVAISDDQRSQELLRQICDLVISSSEEINASADVDGSVRLTASRHQQYTTAPLVISTSAAASHGNSGHLTYHAIPSNRPSPDCEQSGVQGTLSMSAGTVQTTNRNETWNCGCVVVNADLKTRELSTVFSISNPVRFISETLNLTDVTTADRLVSDIAEASRALHRVSGQTVIVDWTINAPLSADALELSGLTEENLLGRLRNHLEAGHQGVWPRRIQFGESADLQLSSTGGAAVEEYFDVVTGTVTTQTVNSLVNTSNLQRGGRGVASELITGLQLLTDAA